MKPSIRTLLGIVGIVTSLVRVSAQTPIVVGAGYAPPSPMIVSPGQVITLYLHETQAALSSSSRSIQAGTAPLPTTLGGFSVTVRQGTNTYPAPLFSVVQTTNCTDTNQSLPGCITTALMLQIPFELFPAPTIEVAAQLPGDLSVSDNGTESGHFPIAVITDNFHVLTVCDSQAGSPPLFRHRIPLS
jgi:hypothetical protein